MYFNFSQKDEDPENLYNILVIEPKASKKDIKKAYRKLALKHHPDKLEKGSKDDSFVKINRAYNILSNENQRQLYDNYGIIEGETNSDQN